MTAKKSKGLKPLSMRVLLDLNDAELTLYRDDAPIYRQPAVAHVGAKRCLFGLEALRLARLHPQQANQHYLARLNADPLPVAGARAVNHADLVYLHLLELKESLGDAGPIVAVPGSLDAEQLGVLLGIAQEAGIELRGFVDSAVLMGSTATLPGRCWLLDLHLNSAYLTELRADTEVIKVSGQELPGCGLLSCLDGWANLLADRFLQDTRFDPLHAAATEQQLYNQLYDWAQAGQGGASTDGDFVAEIQQDGQTRRVRVPRHALGSKLMRRFQPVTQKLPDNATLLLAPRCAALPELSNGLAELGLHTHNLAADALQQGCVRHAQAIAAGPLTLISRLPCMAVAAGPQPDTRPPATHVLFDNRAWPLTDNPFTLPAQGRIGDRIDKDGKSLRLIRVERVPGEGQEPGSREFAASDGRGS